MSSQLLLSGSPLKPHQFPQVVGPDAALHSALDEADDSHFWKERSFKSSSLIILQVLIHFMGAVVYWVGGPSNNVETASFSLENKKHYLLVVSRDQT